MHMLFLVEEWGQKFQNSISHVCQLVNAEILWKKCKTLSKYHSLHLLRVRACTRERAIRHLTSAIYKHQRSSASEQNK